MSRRVFMPLLLSVALMTERPARGDEFRQLVGSPLFDLVNRPDAKSHSALTFRELEALPATLSDVRVPIVVVATDQGNVSKLVLSPGFRRAKEGDDDKALVPIVVIERFETIDAGDKQSCKARGKEITLYDGFELDLDSGQIVPAGLGGDLMFRNDGPAGARIVALGKSRLTTFEKALPATLTPRGGPSTGRGVQPTDFAGRYMLAADGQWSGLLELVVDTSGKVTGRFRSDKNGRVYDVAGALGVDNPRKVVFTIQFPRSRQTFEGLLWTEGKNVIAGTLTILEHAYSFVAIREGASLIPDDLELETGGSLDLRSRLPDKRKRLHVTLGAEADRVVIDGVVTTVAEVQRKMAEAIKQDSTAEVVLGVGDAVPFDRTRSIVRILRSAGVKTIRLSIGSIGDDVREP